MISHSWSLSSRARWAAAFALLFLVTTAVPVLAAESPAGEVSLAPSSLQAQADWLPDAADVQEGIEIVQSEEAAREDELESPEAVAEREESRDAFANLGVGGAQDLLQTFFADQLAKLNTDPARTLSDAEIVRTIGATAATVTEDGDGALLDAGIPVRTEDEDGDLRKVDLSLEVTAAGFETVNALSDVQIGDSAEEPVEVGEEGVAISQVGAASSSAARRFGDQNVFHFEALTDTDTLVSPTASGVEIFNLLRSEESPETFRFEIELPLGAELLSDGQGGVAVMRDGETIAAIPFPTAVDAQGTDVPVELTIEGSSLVLHVDHRQGDYAMPILLDPILEDWVNSNTSWHNGHNLQALYNGAWQWTSSGLAVSTGCMYACWGSGNGLYVSAPSGNYGANNIAHWAYSAPNMGSYVSKVWLIPFYRHDHECSKSQYGQPHDYEGFWGDSQWNLVHANQAINVGSYANESWGRAFVVGLGTGGGVNIPCWRDLYVGGAAVWLDDWESPSVSASVSGVPSGWFNGTQITVGASTADSGLGVRRATLTTEGKGVTGEDLLGCTGLYANRCPNTRNSQFKLTGSSLGEGVRASSVSVEDPTGKAASGGNFQTKVDHSPPEVFLDDQLAEATEDDEGEAKGDAKTEKLRLPVYNLKVEAKDGSNASNLTRRSGVKNIEVFLDGVKQSVPWSAQSATEDSRPMTQTYQLKLSTVTTAGLHKLEVKVRDQVDNVRERILEFQYFPATGMKDEYVMHYFPLPDGQGNEEEEEHPDRPELAVNVMNGNLVYREQDVDVEGAAVDLEVERYYNSQLPENEDTEWGDGWTLAQTPDLELFDTGGSPAADKADVLDSSGTIEDGVQLPTETGQKEFDPSLRATFVKRAGGGYEMIDETGESATSIAFDATGQAEALLTDGYAKVDYSYEAGALSEIAVEDPGSTDLLPDEVEEPEIEPAPSLYTDAFYYESFGDQGEGEGELEAPGDIARDAGGNLWVADTDNGRIQKFNEEGELLKVIAPTHQVELEGELVEVNYLDRPAAIDIDPTGNVWVADIDAVLELNGAGELLSQFKDTGSSLREFNEPQGIAVDTQGNFWVANTLNGQLQKYDKDKKLIRAIGQGQLGEPTDIDLDGEGNVWALDSGADRIVVFSDSGQLLHQFGSPGSGDGEFEEPNALDVEPEGVVWVGDSDNGRVQWFDEEGEYLGQFGSEGAGEGEFGPGPLGIHSDGDGGVWVADGANHRIQRWIAGSYVPGEEVEPPQDDPAVEIETDDGLVSSLVGEKAGEHSYEHDGDFLVSHDGPEGETLYEKNAAGLLSKVTLPNGTWASIEYFADNRVKSVTVKLAGEPSSKKTTIEYQDAPPRRTVVDPPDAPRVTYEIGADGSVFKWWNAEQPPTFDFFGGTLWDHKEEEGGLWAGDHTLDVQAFHPEGIASIQVIANGDQLVHETTCDQTKAEGECVEPPVQSEWVANTEQLNPGHLQIEVIATDYEGGSASERFWVDIPEPPPPPAPGTPIPPRFSDILRFRGEYGLEKVFPVANEIERNERIFNLIKGWHEGNAVARASANKWGVPLRLADMAELEYRQWLYDVNADRIDQWVEASSPASYAGYYLDHAAGGIMHVGFVANQEEQLVALKSSLSLVAGERLETYTTTPIFSFLAVRAASESVSNAIESNPTLSELAIDVKFDESGRSVRVGTPNVAQAKNILGQIFGPSAPISVEYVTGDGDPLSGRFRNKGRMRAGDFIVSRRYYEGVHIGNVDCTAGFGAKDQAGVVRGKAVWSLFVLTAGHCTQLSYQNVYRSTDADPLDDDHWTKVGMVTRDAFSYFDPVRTDAEAIEVEGDGIVPQGIFGSAGELIPTKPAATAKKGDVVCYSGAKSQAATCGHIVARSTRWTGGGDGAARGGYWVAFNEPRPGHGDSGAPVWNLLTGASIGLVTAGRPHNVHTETLVEPLLHPPHLNGVPGILNSPHMGSLSLKLGQ